MQMFNADGSEGEMRQRHPLRRQVRLRARLVQGELAASRDAAEASADQADTRRRPRRAGDRRHGRSRSWPSWTSRRRLEGRADRAPALLPPDPPEVRQQLRHRLRLDGQPARRHVRRRRRRHRPGARGTEVELHSAFPRRINATGSRSTIAARSRCGPGSAAAASPWPAGPGAPAPSASPPSWPATPTARSDPPALAT